MKDIRHPPALHPRQISGNAPLPHFVRRSKSFFVSLEIVDCRQDLHSPKSVYIGTMLATPELIRETAQLSRLAELLPRWRQVPLYRDSLKRFSEHNVRAGLQQLPFLR